MTPARLAHLDRATGQVIHRYEHAAPGDLVHVGIKTLGDIPDGIGTAGLDGMTRGSRCAGPGRPGRDVTIS